MAAPVTGLSESFKYGPKQAAVAAANVRVSVPTYNKSSFTRGGEKMMFNIPCGKRGQYLNTRMSYLKFEVRVKVNPDSTTIPILGLDGGAHSFIHSLEVYHGTNMLEQIREYNSLYQLLLDQGMSAGAGMMARSIAEGHGHPDVYTTGRTQHRVGGLLTPFFTEKRVTRNGKVDDLFGVTASTAGKAAADIYDNVKGPVVITKSPEAAAVEASGNKVGSGTHGALCTNEVVYTFCLPLVSGVVGAQMAKYLPIGSMISDLRLELEVAPFSQAVTCMGIITKTTATAVTGEFDSNPDTIVQTVDDSVVNSSQRITIDNPELHLEFIEVSADVQMAIESANGGQYVMSYDSFNNFSNSVEANSQSVTQLIGAKFSSIKGITTTFKDQSHVNDYRFYGVTSRVNPFQDIPNRRELVDACKVSNPQGKYNSGVGWRYTIGATHYPPRDVISDQESFYEALKGLHLIASKEVDGLFDSATWQTSARSQSSLGGKTVYSDVCLEHGTFYMAQNFESQSHKSHLIDSGINTLAQHMYMHLKLPPPKTPFADDGGPKYVGSHDQTVFVSALGTTPLTATFHMPTLAVDHFIHFDGILICANGVCSTRF